MHNPKTSKIMISRDVIWQNKKFHEYYGIKTKTIYIEDTEPERVIVHNETPNIEVDDEDSENSDKDTENSDKDTEENEVENKPIKRLMRELKGLKTFYNQQVREATEFAFPMMNMNNQYEPTTYDQES